MGDYVLFCNLKTTISSSLRKSFVHGLFACALLASPAAASDAVTSTKTAPVIMKQAKSNEFLSFLSRRNATTVKVEEFSYSRDWINSQSLAKGDAEWACLSEALYFEARGESVKGQFAVAEVIMNRVDSAKYPNSICAVVNQGTGKKYQCQFTYTCDGKKEIFNEKKARQSTQKIAAALIEGVVPRALTSGATHYHTKSVNPSWARSFPRVATIGVHHFYRQPGSGATS